MPSDCLFVQVTNKTDSVILYWNLLPLLSTCKPSFSVGVHVAFEQVHLYIPVAYYLPASNHIAIFQTHRFAKDICTTPYFTFLTGKYSSPTPR